MALLGRLLKHGTGGQHDDCCFLARYESAGFRRAGDASAEGLVTAVFAVAYPDGYRGCWADGRGVTTADEAGVDDVAFLRAIIDWSAERHGTWPDRRR